MSTNAVTVPTAASIVEAAKLLLEEERISGVPVVNGQGRNRNRTRSRGPQLWVEIARRFLKAHGRHVADPYPGKRDRG